MGPGFSRQGPEILLAGVGSVPEGPSRHNSTLRPSRGFRLCKKHKDTHRPLRPSALPGEGPGALHAARLPAAPVLEGPGGGGN